MREIIVYVKSSAAAAVLCDSGGTTITNEKYYPAIHYAERAEVKLRPLRDDGTPFSTGELSYSSYEFGVDNDWLHSTDPAIMLNSGFSVSSEELNSVTYAQVCFVISGNTEKVSTLLNGSEKLKAIAEFSAFPAGESCPGMTMQFPFVLRNRLLDTGSVPPDEPLNNYYTIAQADALYDAKEDSANKGAANGYAELDAGGRVPVAQIPGSVDEVIEAVDFAALPGTGEPGKIYITLDDNKTYRWSGSAYVEISASLALGETSGAAYRGDRGKTAYDHSQLASGNPHGVTKTDLSLQNVDNTSDMDKPVSTAQQAALNGKVDTTITVNGHALSGNVTVTKEDLGLGNVTNILNKLDATAAPTANDDSGDGYSVGSKWIDVTNDKAYTCVDATVGAAVWDTGGSGASAFTGLTDAPGSYNGQAGKVPAVNAAEDELEFTPLAVPDDTFVDADLNASDQYIVNGTKSVVAVVDDDDEPVNPDSINYLTNTTIDLSSYAPITGSWKVKFAQIQQGITVPTSNMTDEWTFESISGTTVYNTGSSGKNGALVGSPSLVTGVVGDALDITGSSQYMTYSTVALSGAWTAAIWVKTSDVTNQGSDDLAVPCFMTTPGGSWNRGFGINNGKICFNKYSVGYFYGTSNVSDGAWHLLTWVSNSSDQIQMYVDGVAEGSLSAAASGTGTNATGANRDFARYSGAAVYDQPRIYNAELSAAQVLQIFNAEDPS